MYLGNIGVGKISLIVFERSLLMLTKAVSKIQQCDDKAESSVSLDPPFMNNKQLHY